MIGFLLLLAAFGTLYVLSRMFIRKLLTFLFRITGDRQKATFILGLIFLPGTFVHEMAHFITALFLLVSVGKLNLMPEVRDDGIKLGSVSIGETDIFRGTLIGLAPLILGSSLLIWAVATVLSKAHPIQPVFVVLLIYAIFELTHTMFSSKSDLRAVLELIIFLIILSTALVALKIFGPFLLVYSKILEIGPEALKLSELLLVPIGLETIFILLFKGV